MSELIVKADGSPFVTREAAKSKRTRMGKEGLDTNIIVVDGGFALEKTRYEKPRKRIPLGKRNVLSYPKDEQDPNFVYRIVNDEPGRIKMFRDAGWDVVEKRGGSLGDPQVGVSEQVGSVVTKSVGGGQVGYLMRIKKEFYKEDQEAKAANIRELEEGLKTQKQGQYGKVEIEEKQARR